MKRTPTREQVERAAQVALEKRAVDLLLLDLKGVVSFARYFLLCTGQSARQVKAIGVGIEERLRAQGLRPLSVEGYQNAEWVLLDYVDFVVHIFSPTARTYYDLDRLWRRAAPLPLPAASEASSAAS